MREPHRGDDDEGGEQVVQPAGRWQQCCLAEEEEEAKRRSQVEEQKTKNQKVLAPDGNACDGGDVDGALHQALGAAAPLAALRVALGRGGGVVGAHCMGWGGCVLGRALSYGRKKTAHFWGVMDGDGGLCRTMQLATWPPRGDFVSRFVTDSERCSRRP